MDEFNTAAEDQPFFTGLGTATLAAHTIVKQIIDFCLGLIGTFSTVAQTLIASCLGKVTLFLSDCAYTSYA